MNKGGFKLRKWNSNSKTLRDRIAAVENFSLPNNEIDATQQASVSTDTNRYVKFLGINWNADTDSFRPLRTICICSGPFSNQTFCFETFSLRSPGPCHNLFVLKELTGTISWKEQISPVGIPSLPNSEALNDIKILRYYFYHTDKLPFRSYQNHGFGDASDKAFAAVVYLTTEHSNGEIETNLRAS